jgi:hypothetical protein
MTGDRALPLPKVHSTEPRRVAALGWREGRGVALRFEVSPLQRSQASKPTNRQAI